MILKLGDKGYHVALMQNFLYVVNRENSGIGIIDLDTDGTFGADTKRAVRQFQKYLGVDPTGEWDDAFYSYYDSLFHTLPKEMQVRSVRALTARDDSGVTDLGTVEVTASPLPAPSTDAGSAWSSPAQVKAEAAQKKAQYDRGKYPNGQTEAHSSITRLASNSDDKFGNTNADLEMLAKSAKLLKVEIWPFHDQGAKVVFYGIPEEITDTNQNNFVPIAVKGRSAPFQDYENSGPRKLNFSILLHMEYCPGRKILPVVNTLRSFTYPRKQGNIKPIVCNFFVGPTHVKVVIDNVQVTWKKPIIEGWYSMAEVAMNMTEVVPNSIIYDQVKQQSRFK